MTTLSLSSQFEIERLKRHLQRHPEQANFLAIAYFQDYLDLVYQYQKLEKKLSSSSPSPTARYTKLQIDYCELLKYCIQLQTECANLREDNQALRNLIDILAPDLPLSLKKDEVNYS